MATTKIFPRTRWNTLHKNGWRPLKWMISTKLEKRSNMPNVFDRFNDAASEIRHQLQLAKDANQGFRAFGTKWSMSSIAHQKDRMHFNSLMNIKIGIRASDLHNNSTYQAEKLHLLECGNQVKEVSFYLEGIGQSLKASGASNGQTIAGCISTGVHGAAIDVGSVQDYVVGLNLIIGPKPEDIVYIERHSKPALSNAFAQKINARVIRNDDLFNAALVGLGSFGFIHGVVIEAEDRYLLSRNVIKVKKEKAIALAETLNFKDSDVIVNGQVDQNGKPLRPYHYKVYVNQYDETSQDYPVEFMYKKPWDPNYKQTFGDPIPFMKEFIYRDLIYLFIKISEKFPRAIKKFIKALSKSILPSENKVIVGMLSEIFWDAGYQGEAFACSFGIDHRDTGKALDILTKLTKDEGPIPGIFAMRFIEKSDALLSFARFPKTCMIEIDGIQWDDKSKIISLDKYMKRMIEVMQANQIPFTIHWGKNAKWDFPNLANHMYGQDATKWMDIRSALLSAEMAAVFSNDFLEKVSLHHFNPAADPNLIRSH